MNSEPTQAQAVAPARSSKRRWSVAGTAVSASLIAVCVTIGLAAALPANTLQVFTSRDAGPFVALALPAVRAVFDFAGALTVGWLVAAALLAPPKPGSSPYRFDVSGYRSARAASLAASVWAAAALALIPLSYSYAAGRSLGDALRPESLQIGVNFFDPTTAAFRAFLLIAVVAILARVVLRPAGAFGLLLLAGVALLPVGLTGHASASGDHDLASDTMVYHLIGVSVWVGGLVAFLGLARQRVPHLDLIARRYSAVALVAFIAVGLSGLGNAWVRLPMLSDLVTTEYGWLVLLKTALLVVLGGFGYVQRRRSVAALQQGNRRPLLTLAVAEIMVMAAAIGVAVALGRTAPPPPMPVAPSELSLVLGYDLAGPPTLWNLLTQWRLDLIFGVGALVLAALYGWGVRRLRQRKIDWPWGRTIAWVAGCATLLVATSSGIGKYEAAQFSVHMVSHMLLGMVVPILLVLGAPTTLALRALPAARGDGVPGAREALLGLTKSRLLRWLTQPLVIFIVFVGSFFALYFTPLFPAMLESHVGHLAMNLHFLTVGYLFYWVIIGIDPAPRRLTPVLKLAMLLGTLPFHAFFGLSLMNSRTLLAGDYYQSLQLPWMHNLLGDQHLGGGIAWGGAEIPLVIVVVALLVQWSRSDEREARRSDRKADLDDDSDLAAYNAMLQRLSERDLTR